jgi:peptidyl-tRNA hydrolase
MNLSGKVVILKKENIPLENLLVIADDLNLSLALSASNQRK